MARRHVPDQHSSIPRSTLLACGGLDETLLAKDDFELGLRLWKMGVRFQYLPDAVAYELSVKSWRSFLFRDGEAFGRTEVILCRKHPDYRGRSHLLAGLGTTVWWKRLLRRMVLQSPVSVAHLLTLPIWLCEKLCRYPLMQKTGLRLLEFGRRITEFRGALKKRAHGIISIANSPCGCRCFATTMWVPDNRERSLL